MTDSFLNTGGPLGSDEELTAVYHRHIDTVYRVCRLHLRSVADAEDAAQDTFVRLIQSAPVFESAEHEKAWLLRTAINLCLNRLKHWWRKTVGIAQLGEIAAEAFVPDETIEKVRSLPPKYRNAIFLHYYEGYTAAEIAGITGSNPSTVRSHLMTGRRLLKFQLESEINET